MNGIFNFNTYSIYGIYSKTTNTFGTRIVQPAVTQTTVADTREDDLLEVYQYLLRLVESFETFVNSQVSRDPGFSILPTATLPNVSVRMTYPQFISRRIYYGNGNSPLPDGTIDYRILRQIYLDNPILQRYDFATSEPEAWI
jgi:hypothetical protein